MNPIAVLTGPTLEEVSVQKAYATRYTDLFELRMDLIQAPIEALFKKIPPEQTVITLRSRKQGGAFCGTIEKRNRYLHNLLPYKPAFIDLEWPEDTAWLNKVTHSILSFHGPLAEVQQAIAPMQALPATLYKWVAYTEDCPAALRWLADPPPKGIFFAAGREMEWSRLLAKRQGSITTFFSSGRPTAPGQMDGETLFDLYKYRQINSATRLFGLIGNPVSLSQGHIWHNHAFKERGINALYLKLPVGPEELPLLAQLGFEGLSVTMPWKEQVAPGQITNTLSLNPLRTYNTDGSGAIMALEEKGFPIIPGSIALIIGYGATGKAIGQALRQRGVEVHFFNRTPYPETKPLDQLQAWMPQADLVVQATCLGMQGEESSLVDPSWWNKRSWAFEVVNQPTLFIQQAEKAGCSVLLGKEFFEAQAKQQQVLWVGG